jgi:pimeloyl-ACP methyl ester carboxylesterase
MSLLFNLSGVWWRRIAQSLVGLLLTTVAIGSLYQIISLSRDRRTHPMPGLLVDVGGYKMHICCVGHGSPAVILDSGLGDSFISWKNVQPQTAEFVRVCSFDRAGMGYSESSPRARTSVVFAEELHQVLHNAGIAPPYILVGDSMPAFNVRLNVSLFDSVQMMRNGRGRIQTIPPGWQCSNSIK